MEFRVYMTRDGRTPFVDWLGKLRDSRAHTRIRIQLDRMLLGHQCDRKSLGNGLFEIHVHYGPGYRVYFGKDGSQLVLLFCAGNKSTQQSDIRLANKYWQDYRSRADDEK